MTPEKTLAERLTELILDRDSGGDRQLAFFVRFNQSTILAALSDAERREKVSPGAFGEPWRIGGKFDSDTVDRDGSLILYGTDFSPVRRDRMIACVNACSGISDPQAELSRLRADAERMREEIVELNKSIERMVECAHACDEVDMALRQLVAWGLTCKLKNTPLWMRGLATRMNTAATCLGDDGRCHFDGNEFQVTAALAGDQQGGG